MKRWSSGCGIALRRPSATTNRGASSPGGGRSALRTGPSDPHGSRRSIAPDRVPLPACPRSSSTTPRGPLALLTPWRRGGGSRLDSSLRCSCRWWSGEGVSALSAMWNVAGCQRRMKTDPPPRRSGVTFRAALTASSDGRPAVEFTPGFPNSTGHLKYSSIVTRLSGARGTFLARTRRQPPSSSTHPPTAKV